MEAPIAGWGPGHAMRVWAHTRTLAHAHAHAQDPWNGLGPSSWVAPWEVVVDGTMVWVRVTDALLSNKGKTRSFIILTLIRTVIHHSPPASSSLLASLYNLHCYRPPRAYPRSELPTVEGASGRGGSAPVPGASSPLAPVPSSSPHDKGDIRRTSKRRRPSRGAALEDRASITASSPSAAQGDGSPSGTGQERARTT